MRKPPAIGENVRTVPPSARGAGFSPSPIALLTAALACAVVASRLAVFHYGGSILPYYDQWFVEFENGFLSVARGMPPLEVLFLPHNEHRLVTTKLLSFVGFLVNGYWDVRFLVIIAALVRAGEAAILFRLLLPVGPGRLATWGWWCACLVVFASPLSGYNLLCGLQVSFFLAELSLLAAIALVSRWQGSVRDAVALVAIQLFGLASFGSALAIPLATAAVHWAASRPRRWFWPSWSLSLAVSVGWATAGAGNAAGEQAVRIRFFLELLAWPLSSAAWGLLLAVVGIVAVVKSKNHSSTLAATAGVLVFAAANAAMLAYGRPPQMLHPRHWDLLALLPLGWLALGLQLAPKNRTAETRLVLVPVVLTYGVFLATLVWYTTWPYLKQAHVAHAETEARMRRLLLSDQIYQEAARLNRPLHRRDHLFFDHPFERYMMHPTIARNYHLAPLPALAVLSPELIPTRPVAAGTQLMTWLVKWAGWLAVPAAILASAALARSKKVLTTDASPNGAAT
jgi:hypothetical protein